MKIASIILLFYACIASAQTYVPMPTPKQQFFDNNGLPVAGGKLCTYAAGTTTPQATYADAIGTPNTNPVTLDSSGRAVVFFLNVSYKVTLQDSTGTPGVCDGAPIWTVDQVSSLAQLPAGGTVTSADTTVAFNATPTFTATAQVQLLRMTLTGNVTSSTFSAAGVTVPALVTFILTQDAVGGRTFAWPPNAISPSVITSTASKSTTEIFMWDGTSLYPIGPGVFSIVNSQGPDIQAGALQLFHSVLIGGSSGTLTLPTATDTLVGKATTDTLTGKTYDTAGAGNVLKINGTTVNAVRGNSSRIQLNNGALTNGNFVAADANGNTVDSGIAVPGSSLVTEYFTPVFTKTCAPAGCATFGASPQTVSPAGLTIQSADMTAGAVFEFWVHYGASENAPCGGPCASTISMLLGGVDIGCGAATSGTGGGTGPAAGYRGLLKILTTGAGGTAKVQCSGAALEGSTPTSDGVAFTNSTDATFALNTTADRSFTFQSTNDTVTTRAIFYDMEMKKIN